MWESEVNKLNGKFDSISADVKNIGKQFTEDVCKVSTAVIEHISRNEIPIFVKETKDKFLEGLSENRQIMEDMLEKRQNYDEKIKEQMNIIEDYVHDVLEKMENVEENNSSSTIKKEMEDSIDTISQNLKQTFEKGFSDITRELKCGIDDINEKNKNTVNDIKGDLKDAINNISTENQDISYEITKATENTLKATEDTLKATRDHEKTLDRHLQFGIRDIFNVIEKEAQLIRETVRTRTNTRTTYHFFFHIRDFSRRESSCVQVFSCPWYITQFDSCLQGWVEFLNEGLLVIRLIDGRYPKIVGLEPKTSGKYKYKVRAIGRSENKEKLLKEEIFGAVHDESQQELHGSVWGSDIGEFSCEEFEKNGYVVNDALLLKYSIKIVE